MILNGTRIYDNNMGYDKPFPEGKKVYNIFNYNQENENALNDIAKKAFDNVDKDNNGTIDYNEFALLIKNILLSLIKNEEGDENEEDIDI